MAEQRELLDNPRLFYWLLEMERSWGQILSSRQDIKLSSSFFRSVTLTGIFHGFDHPWGFPGGANGKESACNEGDWSWVPESGRSPGERNGYPLQYACLENPMDRGATDRLQSIGSQSVERD